MVFAAHLDTDKVKMLLDYSKLGLCGQPGALTVDNQGFVWLACNGGGQRVGIMNFVLFARYNSAFKTKCTITI